MKSKSRSLTIVIGFRDRESERVQRCLKSLENQTFRDFEVIFVDYGSQTACARSVQETLGQFPFVKYIYSDTRGHPWNRARALNIGGRLAKSTYLMTTDVDMIFPPEFLSVVVKNAGPKKALCCAWHFLPDTFNDWEHLKNYAGKFKTGRAGNKGGCQVIPTRVFREMRGFDETYQYWGIEDNDLNRRLIALGFKEHWLNDQTHIFHQWHPIENYVTPGFMPLGHWGLMQNHYYRHLGEVKRNDADWGGVMRAKDRPVFKFLDIEHSAIDNNKRVRVIDPAPNNNTSINAFLKAFWDLSHGDALLVKHSVYPHRSGWADALIAAGNAIAGAFQSDIKFDYSPDLLSAFIIEFLSENGEFVSDYYLGFPAFDGVAILVRA